MNPNSSIQNLSHLPIGLPIDRIKTRLKLPRRSELDSIEGKIEEYFELVEPIARFSDLTCKVENDIIRVGESYEIKSKSLFRHLSECDRVTMLAVTIGHSIENRVRELQTSGQMLDPLILDAIGSECVEESAQFLSNLVDEKIRRQRRIPTKRFSPGYGDLSLEVQRFFFSHLMLDEIGMTLNESLLMVPQKSITAFIGWQK